MGYFADFAWVDGAWRPGQPDTAIPTLTVSIEDSDIAKVQHAPTAGGAIGSCYLGFEPRHYYDDPSANAPVNVAAESASLAAWASEVTGVKLSPKAVKRLLASPKGKDPKEDFVEDTVAELLNLLGLPELPDTDD